MSDLETKIFATLSSSPALMAVVGNRVFPVLMPQKCALPAVTYQRISGGQVTDLRGETGAERPRIQIDCWADTYAKAKQAARAVRAAMAAPSGFNALIIDDSDMFEGEQHYYRVSMDYSCWHLEAQS